MDRQGIEIKTKQGLFMKMNGLGCCFVELTVTNHAWASVLNSIQATRGRMLMPMDLGRVTLYQVKPASLCCIQRCNLYCILPILRSGPFHVSHFNGELAS